MKSTARKIMDKYLKYPIIGDILIVLVLLFLWDRYSFISFSFPDKGTLLNVVSSIIGTCVSLAGFILAALTIIVTFRSNLKAKGVNTSDNAMELIITSGHYPKIVDVYTKAIYEFLLISFGMYFYWLSSDNIANTLTGTKIVLSGVLTTATTVYRSLWVLFTILNLEKFNKQ